MNADRCQKCFKEYPRTELAPVLRRDNRGLEWLCSKCRARRTRRNIEKVNAARKARR